MMSAPLPNQIIGTFVNSANPQVVQAMSGAVNSLLGGLSSPNMGVQIQVKASGEKIRSLCFQLQMTGALRCSIVLYCIAFCIASCIAFCIKDLMKLRGKKLTIQDYNNKHSTLT